MILNSITKVVFSVIVLSNVQTYCEEVSSDNIRISGRTLSTFAEDSFVLETDKYNYKIEKTILSKEVVRMLERASGQSKLVQVEIPRKAIQYIWPSRKVNVSDSDTRKYSQFTQRLAVEAKENKGLVSLKGTSVYSFSEPYFLVEVGQSIYQLKKSSLSKEQRSLLDAVYPGDRVEIAVKKSAVGLSWNFKQSVARGVASAQPMDEVKYFGSSIQVKGTLLHSFDDPFVLVQSQDAIYQIRRNEISTLVPKALDRPGSSVQLQAPVRAVELIWPSNPGIMHVRFPANALD